MNPENDQKQPAPKTAHEALALAIARESSAARLRAQATALRNRGRVLN